VRVKNEHRKDADILKEVGLSLQILLTILIIMFSEGGLIVRMGN
jgi:hypothetical protein